MGAGVGLHHREVVFDREVKTLRSDTLGLLFVDAVVSHLSEQVAGLTVPEGTFPRDVVRLDQVVDRTGLNNQPELGSHDLEQLGKVFAARIGNTDFVGNPAEKSPIHQVGWFEVR